MGQSKLQEHKTGFALRSLRNVDQLKNTLAVENVFLFRRTTVNCEFYTTLRYTEWITVLLFTLTAVYSAHDNVAGVPSGRKLVQHVLHKVARFLLCPLRLV